MSIGSRVRIRPLILVALALSLPAVAADFYVNPWGTTSQEPGTGSPEDPWSLQTALSHPSAVRPGDTIWLAGGTYSGTFESTLTGTANAPIVVRAMPGERVTLDGGDSGGDPVLLVSGSYAWYWGFEVTSSDGKRVSAEDGPWPSDIGRGEGVQILQTPGSGVGTKFIDMIVHDTRQGFSFWSEAQDAEISGCLVYYNGWQGATDRGHGHGAYVQNQTGTKLLSDNIVFRNFSHGLHAFASDAGRLDGIQYVGNTSFSNGEPGGAFTRNLLTGGDVLAHRPVWDANMTFDPVPYGVNALGYAAGCTDATVTGNYLVGASKALVLSSCSQGLTVSGNTFYGIFPPDGLASAQYPLNTYLTTQPGGVDVFVRKSMYEPGRANVTVYAWDGRTSAEVDLSGVLAAGDEFEVRDAQNYFGSPVVAGTYSGAPVLLPLADLPPAAPVGMSPPDPTGPLFNAFVVLTIPPAPNASFAVTPLSASSGESVSFTDASAGTVTSWIWDFGDGALSTLRNPTHAYSSAGRFPVTLTVAGPGGRTTARQVLVVKPGAADF